MPDYPLVDSLAPFLHKAQLANAVTGLATCLAGVVPLLFCLLGRPQPVRWLVAYACILLTGIPTVWLHAYEGYRLASFFDVGTNILLAFALQAAVAGDFLGTRQRRRVVATSLAVNTLVWLWLAREVVVAKKTPVVVFGQFGEFYFGETALILNAFAVVGLFAFSYRHIPVHARPMLHLVIATFLLGLFLASASNGHVSGRIFAWHAIWHLVGAFGFIMLWYFNDLRFNPLAAPGNAVEPAAAGTTPNPQKKRAARPDPAERPF